jgi:hypothetical protein
MNLGDLPSIAKSGHSHTAYGLGNLTSPINAVVGTTTAMPFTGVGNIAFGATGGSGGGVGQSMFDAQEMATGAMIRNRRMFVQPQPKEKPMTPSRRLVQVFIADPDENVPLEKALLYTGEQKLTDATDQELFFEIDMKSVLEAHNSERIKIINRKVKERTEYLEPVKIRDLKMVVVDVATFSTF